MSDLLERLKQRPPSVEGHDYGDDLPAAKLVRAEFDRNLLLDALTELLNASRRPVYRVPSASSVEEAAEIIIAELRKPTPRQENEHAKD